MRFPLSWLKEFIPVSLSPTELAKKLTMIGLEVDSVESKAEGMDPSIVVASVLSTEKHPNADRLTVAKVSDGVEEFQVVCGAPNCRPGIKTAFAKVGAVLNDEEGAFTIKKSKLRGVESSGMLCSEKELRLSEEGDSIIELPSNLKEGTPLSKLYNESFFEISLTPNLNHAGSVMGVARELAAADGVTFHLPLLSLKEEGNPIEDSLRVRVLDQEACPRYSCRVIKNVKVGPSPDWLIKRLEGCGLRSVNNVVDVTNYLLLAFGHPLHAFNADSLEGDELLVRKAKEGEKIVTLDGKERELKESMLLIGDTKKALAIAGVMGGAISEVDETTHKILLEAAYFEPSSIRRTSKLLGLQTEASRRFERGSDPNQILYVLDLAAQMIQEVAGGVVESGRVDVKAKEFPASHVTCRLSRIHQVLGLSFSRGEVETFFQNLAFPAQWDGQDRFTVEVPTYRVDIKGEIDLIEEVARLYGYENIPRKGSGFLSSTLPHSPIYLLEKTARQKLLEEGLQEFLTCDLIGPSLLDIIKEETLPPEMVVKVLNPTSIEQSILRTSLLPGLLQVVKYNRDHQSETIAGFEIGRIHWKNGDNYEEQSIAALILTGKSTPDSWDQNGREYDFFDLKGIVEDFLAAFGIVKVTYKNLGLKTFHSGRQASLFVEGVEIGSIGEIHPSIQRRLDSSQRLFFGEFNLQNLQQVIRPFHKLQPLSLYPSSERDWTVTLKKSIPYEVLADSIRKKASPLLEKFSLKAIYSSEKIGAEHHNLTLHFVYRDSSKTIQNETVDREQERLVLAVIEEMHDAIKL